MNLTQNHDIKKEAGLFFIATYAFSWIVFFVGDYTGILPLVMLGVWGPSIISVILTSLFYGKAGIKQFFSRFKRVKIKWVWWVTLLILPAAIHLTGRSLWELYYYGEIKSSVTPIQYWLNAIIPSFIIAGLGEELGWRGFLLPRLQRLYTPFKATMIIAIIHMFWHLPTYWLGQGMHNVPMIYVFGFLFPWTIIFVWLYNKSGGSLIFAVSFHAISNASLSIVRFLPLDSEVILTPDLITQMSLPIELSGPYLSVVGIYMIVALAVLKYGKFNQVNTDLP